MARRWLTATLLLVLGASAAAQRTFEAQIDAVVYGDLGQLENLPEEFLVKARKVSFLSVFTSILNVPEDSKTKSPVSITPSNHSITSKHWEVEPFQEDGNTIGPDKGSQLRRTRFQYFVHDLESDEATTIINNFCADASRESAELHSAVFRSLDVAKLYPFEVVSRAAQSEGVRRPVTAMIHLSGAGFQFDGQGNRILIDGLGCGVTQPAGDTGEGLFIMPACPVNTARNETNFKDCNCDAGWEGNITLDLKLGIYQGECTRTMLFCPPSVNGITLKNADDQNLATSGQLFVRALPDCVPKTDEDTGAIGFYTSSLASQCTLLTATRGQWVPTPGCSFIPPSRRPTTPTCATPGGDGVTFSGCDTLIGTTCDVGCQGPTYLPLDNPAIVKATCQSSQVACDAPNILTYNRETSECRHSENGELTHEFCCRGVGEAWGAQASAPALQLITRSCSDQTSSQQPEFDCFISQQDSSTPCCWSGGACKAQDEGASDWCAVDLRGVLRAAWTQFPLCAQRCTAPWVDIERITVTGCDQCLPSITCPGCTVACNAGTVQWGGGDLGDRLCDSREAGFGPAPTCHPPLPPTPNCLPPPDQQYRQLTGCVGCLPGSTDCCSAECQAVSRPFGDVEEGPITCQELDTGVAQHECTTQTEREACLNSKQDDSTPCCWRAVVESCVAFGAADMPASEAAPVCAVMKRSAFMDFPDCRPICNTQPLRNEPSIDYKVTDTQCDACFAGDDCVGCTIGCELGGFVSADSPFTNLKCDRTTREYTVPTCRKLVKETAPCTTPAGESLNVTGCASCPAGSADCDCSVGCGSDYALVSGTEGSRTCNKDSFRCLPPAELDWISTPLPSGTCSVKATNLPYEEPFCCWQVEWIPAGGTPPPTEILECAGLARDQCKIASEVASNSDSPRTGIACCWKWDDSGCVRADSAELTGNGPRECSDRTEVFVGRYDQPDPTCAKKCVNPFDATAQHLVVTNCEDCSAGQACNCNVQCKGDGEKSCSFVEGSNAMGSDFQWSDVAFTRNSAAECQASCEAVVVAICHVWTWEASSLKCSLRTSPASADMMNPTAWVSDAGYISGLCTLDGFVRTGGGLAGSRSCTAETPIFAAPPLCIAVETNQCPEFTLSGYQGDQASNCGTTECRVDGNCECHLSCNDDFRRKSTDVGDLKVTCQDVQASLTVMAEGCSTIVNRDACLAAMETEGGQPNRPCCWKASGFSGGSNCAARTSSAIGLQDEPFQCASETKAEWTWVGEKQVCHQKCDPSIYVDNAALLNIENCDNCIPGAGECACEVSCKNTTMALPSAAPEGDKACALSETEGLPTLEAAPMCETICTAPSTDSGTLIVTNCDSCIPGDPASCQCEVSCAPDTFKTAGLEGQHTCQKTAEGNIFSSAQLLKCTPQCKTPSDSFSTRAVTGCGNCAAGTPFSDCACEITCRGIRTGGGPEGRYKCVEFTPEEVDRKMARWEPEDDSANPREEPICLAPVKVTVLDAISNDRLQGCTVDLFNEEDVDLEIILDTQTTDQNGLAQLTTNAARLLVRVRFDGYGEQATVIDRVVECADNPTQCSVRLFMSPALASGDSINPDGCYLAFANDTRWGMRTVLSWSVDALDLDHYARPYSRANEIYERHGCSPEQRKMDNSARCDAERLRFHFERSVDPIRKYRDASKVRRNYPRLSNILPSAITTLTSSYQLKTDEYAWVKFKEADFGTFCSGNNEPFCSDVAVRTRYNYRWGKSMRTRSSATQILRFDGEDEDIVVPTVVLEVHPRPKYPISGPNFDNQFSKWIHWTSCMIDKMEMRVEGQGDGAKVEVPEHLQNWPTDSYMNLDVDSLSLGPETITFGNGPPGLYQVAAADYNFNKAMGPFAKLDLRLGSDVAFECRIDAKCPFESPIWNAVNVRFDDQGDELRIPAIAQDAVNFQIGSIVVVETGPFVVVQGSMTLEKGIRGRVTDLTTRTLKVSFEAPVPPREVSWANFAHFREETISLFNAKKSLRVLELSGKKWFSYDIFDEESNMVKLRKLDMPTQGHFSSRIDWYSPIVAQRDVVDSQWESVCYGKCTLAQGLSPQLDGCLDRNKDNGGRDTWLHRFDWYPNVRFHTGVMGVNDCDRGIKPDKDSCFNAGKYAVEDYMGSPNPVAGALQEGDIVGAPPGCSISSSGDTWVVHFNTNNNGNNGGQHRPVCAGPKM